MEWSTSLGLSLRARSSHVRCLTAVAIGAEFQPVAGPLGIGARPSLRVALGECRTVPAVLDISRRCPAPRGRLEMKVALLRVGEQRIRGRDDSVAKRDP